MELNETYKFYKLWQGYETKSEYYQTAYKRLLEFDET